MNTPAEFDVADLADPLPPGTTLIEASAGTGKTYTIAALFLRLILEHDLSVGEILVTTFTVPATAELRDRIRRVLRSALDAFASGGASDPFLQAAVDRFESQSEAMQDRLARALRNFDEAAIHTIHSFCQRMLQDRAFESGSLFNAELQPDQSRMVREVAEDYWRRQFYQCEACHAAAAMAEGIGPDFFEELLRLRVEHPLSAIIPGVPPGELERTQKDLVNVLDRLRNCWKKSAPEVSRWFAEDNAWAKGDYGKPDVMRAHLDAVTACLEATAAMAGFESFRMFANSNLASGVRAKKAAPCHEFFDLCEELQTAIRRYILALQHDFLAWAPAELERRKVQRNVLSFGDLLTRLHVGLSGDGGPALAQGIRTKFRAALIDEFQDTDSLQDEIFQRVFGDGASWLFLIGDPKQAIYGFRSADVFTYLRASKRAERTFTLGTNFRSATPLVAAVNHVFQQSGNAFVNEHIQFHPVKACGMRDAEAFSGDGVNAPLRLWRWGGDEKVTKDSAEEEVIACVAAEIARLLSGGAKLGDRAVAPADIAVLTATNFQAQRVQAALSRLGVPGVLLSNANVFKSREALELHAILTAAAQPTSESRLRAALFTSVLGVSLTQLHALASDEIAWDGWLLRFQEWHELWSSKGFIRMFRCMLRDGGIRERLLSGADGERRLTNLLHLAELIQAAAVEQKLTPNASVQWLAEQIQDESGSPEAELRLERDDAAVKIVTVHKSKGLEYNIVFCPFLWRSAGLSDKTKRLQFHDPAENDRLTLDFGSDGWDGHWELAETEALAEHVRLLYVALTRARHRCDVVWGRFKGSDKSAAAWLLHPPSAAAEAPLSALAAHMEARTPEQWAADLETLVETSGGTIAVVEMPSPEAARWHPTGAGDAAQRPKAFKGKIEREWCVSSFTSMARNVDTERADFDAASGDEAADEIVAEGIHCLPVGARSGLCLHSLLEDLDFRAPETIPLLTRRKLPAFAIDPSWEEAVAQCIRNVLETPLDPGFSLGDIPKYQRLSELEFYLPAHRLEAKPLRALLGGEVSERLDFASRRGWLKGYIDLIVEHDGRYYLVDWKSNRLGASAEAYNQAALAATMVSHHYGLQLHLYTVALHRYLSHRLKSYDYNRHFGGVFYIFLRGVDPARPDLGVYHRRPDFKTIRAFDEWLTGPA